MNNNLDYSVIGMEIMLGLIAVSIGIMTFAWTIYCIKNLFIMNKIKNWMEGFTSKEEELAYWKEEGKKYKAWLNSEKNIKRSKKPPYGYNPNNNEFNIDFH